MLNLSKLTKTVSMLAVAATLTFSAPMAQAEKTNFTKTEIQQIVEEYIKQNPEVILKSVSAYQDRSATESRADAMATQHEAIFNDPDTPTFAKGAADVTIVEFFDYNCGYCKRAYPVIQALMEEDKNLRFIFKEMPILHETSDLAAKWALAAHKQDKYLEFHHALMQHSGKYDANTMEKISESLDLNIVRMKQDANSTEIEKALVKNRNLARALAISGTPAFIVNTEVIPGMISYEEMKQVIKEQRALLK